MNKKAAIELSVNAIIIIIIAIVMLALALGFVRMLFGGATDKFAGLIEQEAEPEIPTSSNLITLSRSFVMTESSKAEVIKVSVYNPTSEVWNGSQGNGVKLNISCPTNLLTDNDVETNAKIIKQGEYETFDVLFDFPKNATSGPHLCEVKVPGPGHSKDFVIQIR